MAAAFRTMQGESTAPPNAPNAPENGPAAAPSDAGGHRTPPVGQQPAANGGDAFELPAIDAGLVGRPHAGAMYSVEFPVRCPHCKKSVSTFKVFRLLRAQVSFTSTLPRKGYAIVCPECEGLLSADLSGVL
jgi:hypothetical protein